MSGGTFDYKNYLLNDWSHKLNTLIKENSVEDEYGFKHDFNNSTLQVFFIASYFSRVLEIMLHEIDYVVCSDTTEENLEKSIARKLLNLLESEKLNIIQLSSEELYNFIKAMYTAVLTEQKPGHKDSR